MKLSGRLKTEKRVVYLRYDFIMVKQIHLKEIPKEEFEICQVVVLTWPGNQQYYRKGHLFIDGLFLFFYFCIV